MHFQKDASTWTHRNIVEINVKVLKFTSLHQDVGNSVKENLKILNLTELLQRISLQ